MFDKILIPLDETTHSREIVFHCQRLLLKENSVLELFRAVPPRQESWYEKLEHIGSNERHLSLKLQKAREDLQELADDLNQGGFKTIFKVEMGEPAGTILKYIEESQPDLVAMASHTRPGFQRFMRGSVAQRVLQASPVPVLLLHPPHDTEDWHLRFEKILVPLDGSLNSRAILPLVEAFATKFESEVVLVHVMARLLSGPEDRMPSSPLATIREHLEAAKLKVKAVVKSGDPVECLLDVIKEESPDLVAMTTHGYSGLQRWAFGSVALSLLNHMHRPLLLQRISPEEED